MMYPSMTCLCPTYGRPKLLENAIACFLAQDYPAEKKFLLIYDDLGTIVPASSYGTLGGSYHIISSSSREPSLPNKYNHMWHMIVNPDVLVVWEDDDIQLPWCLLAHAKALTGFEWSYPSLVWSDYPNGHTALVQEPSGGRFHGSLAIRHSLLIKTAGWPSTRRADFDQQFIQNLRKYGGEPGDPVKTGHPPAYVFGWHTGYTHGQNTMRSPDDEAWYDNYMPPDPSGPHIITPLLDERYVSVLKQAAPAR